MPELKRLRSETLENASEKIRQMSGRVFHVVQDKVLFRYRITDSGRIVKDKVRREFRRRMTGNPDKKIRDAVLENKNIVQVRREMRKRVTGDPEKKIRDYMTEVPQVKFIDKVYFTFGVGCVVLTEYLALRHPTLFTQYYYLLMSFLVSIRYFQYAEENMELFMLDFCYFANLSTMIQTGVFPNCLLWYKANYVLNMGCLMLAIVVWQNSLVFHSLDKITSFLLHAFPPLTLHMYRWQLIPNNLIPENDSLSWAESFLFPMLLYVGWQLLYLFIMEVVLAGVLARDPDKITSARWLVQDKKNGMHQLVVKICTKQGWMAKGEELDADTWKAKIIFMTSQLVYTVATMLVVPFLYSNYILSVVYIASIYMWCVWRGGTYYIEVFSERYKLQFVNKDEPTHNEDGSVDGHKSEESDNDEVFEDADLFSEIVTALSQEVHSECDTDQSDGKKDDDLEKDDDYVPTEKADKDIEIELSSESLPADVSHVAERIMSHRPPIDELGLVKEDPILGKPMCFKPAQQVDNSDVDATAEVNTTDIMDTVANIISDIQQNKGGYTVESVNVQSVHSSVQSVHSSVQSVHSSSSTTSQTVNISSSSLSTSIEGTTKTESSTEDKNETGNASEETIETVVFTETNTADNGSDSSESSFVDIKKPENQDRLTDCE